MCAAQDPAVSGQCLSGGNQQRLVIAAALERRPTVIVAENPTRGLDLRATAEVHERLRNAARQGVAVIVHFADLDELLELADRIVVLTNGILVETPPGADTRSDRSADAAGWECRVTTRRWAGLVIRRPGGHRRACNRLVWDLRSLAMTVWRRSARMWRGAFGIA